MVTTRGKGGRRRQKRTEWSYTVVEGDLTWGNEHTAQYTDDG